MSLALTHLHCRLDGQAVLQDISLSAGAGCTALIGPNGAGKSTLLRVMAGDSAWLPGMTVTGHAELDGVPLGSLPALSLARRRAFLLQQQPEHLHLPVDELLCLAAWPHGGSGLRGETLYRDALTRWELGTLATRAYDALSGGERQRVQLARTWLQMRLHPHAHERLWLLDEPQTALDLPHQRQLRQQLQEEAASGATVVFSTHDLNFALRSADRVIALAGGRILADGEPAAIADPALLQHVFGVAFSCHVHPGDGRPWVMTE
ncbi:MAG: ATP-binding cassette domain-containing protein [Moraxellaceae bacterium]|nr:ATP-binding cassette domain-containing protein [Moraxellaceae bacterium]